MRLPRRGHCRAAEPHPRHAGDLHSKVFPQPETAGERENQPGCGGQTKDWSAQLKPGLLTMMRQGSPPAGENLFDHKSLGGRQPVYTRRHCPCGIGYKDNQARRHRI